MKIEKCNSRSMKDQGPDSTPHICKRPRGHLGQHICGRLIDYERTKACRKRWQQSQPAPRDGGGKGEGK